MKKVVLSLLAGLMVLGCELPEHHREPVARRRDAAPSYEQWEKQQKAREVQYQEGTRAAEAVKMVHDKVGDPFRTLEIIVHTTFVTVQVQDPHKKENVDEYEVEDGALKGPTPVRLMGEETDEKAVSRSVFDPSTVALDKIADIVKTANEKVQLEGRDHPMVTIRRAMFESKLEITVSYSGARKSGNYTTNAKGEHGKVEID